MSMAGFQSNFYLPKQAAGCIWPMGCSLPNLSQRVYVFQKSLYFLIQQVVEATGSIQSIFNCRSQTKLLTFLLLRIRTKKYQIESLNYKGECWLANHDPYILSEQIRSEGRDKEIRARKRESALIPTYSVPTLGMVVFWNLPTNSPLQRIRLSDGSLKLYPFQCFLAHDQAVRTLQWCKANRSEQENCGGGR